MSILMFQAVITLCSTLMICTAATLIVFLYVSERGLIRVTVQVAAAPIPQVVLQQSAGQVFTAPRAAR